MKPKAENSSGSTASTTPCRYAPSEDDDAVGELKVEAEAEAEASQCNGFPEPKKADDTDRAKEIAELLKSAVEAEVGDWHSFRTAVHDLESFEVLRGDVASRLTTAQRLLKELTAAVKRDSSPVDLRPLFERFAAELGDRVLRRIKSDPILASALDGKLEEVKVEATEEVKPPSPPPPPRKRRRSSALTTRPRKSQRKTLEEEVEEPAEPTVSAARQLLQLHEEAVAELSSLASRLAALEVDFRANEEERVAAQRLTGLLLRKDIETRLPVAKPPAEVSQNFSPFLFIFNCLFYATCRRRRRNRECR